MFALVLLLLFFMILFFFSGGGLSGVLVVILLLFCLSEVPEGFIRGVFTVVAETGEGSRASGVVRRISLPLFSLRAIIKL